MSLIGTVACRAIQALGLNQAEASPPSGTMTAACTYAPSRPMKTGPDPEIPHCPVRAGLCWCKFGNVAPFAATGQRKAIVPNSNTLGHHSRQLGGSRGLEESTKSQSPQRTGRFDKRRWARVSQRIQGCTQVYDAKSSSLSDLRFARVESTVLSRLRARAQMVDPERRAGKGPVSCRSVRSAPPHVRCLHLYRLHKCAPNSPMKPNQQPHQPARISELRENIRNFTAFAAGPSHNISGLPLGDNPRARMLKQVLENVDEQHASNPGFPHGRQAQEYVQA
ncbi:hypothetical protein PSPO01_14621 [Paraphaeosphaeria sporulosa]